MQYARREKTAGPRAGGKRTHDSTPGIESPPAPLNRRDRNRREKTGSGSGLNGRGHGLHPVRCGLVQLREDIGRQMLARQHSEHAIGDSGRQFLRPFVDGLIGDADLSGG